MVANVVGNICESSDYLAKNRNMPASTQEGNIFAIQNAGAYGFTMASNYNQRYRPPEVVLLSDSELKLVRKRETL
jgi:diaminopimelate decarboxylase